MNALDQAIWDTRVKEAVESRKEGAVSNKNLVIIAADNEIKRLTDENAALTSNRAMLNAEATRLTNTIIERNKKIDLRGDNITKLLAERDTLEAEVKFLVEEAKCTESEFEKMEDEYAVIIRELREQLREARDKGSDG